jgi:hypothetical protein
MPRGPGSSANPATVDARSDLVLCSPREAFFAVFSELRRLHESLPRDGVLLAAVRDASGLAAYRHLPLHGASTHAIVGRHERCDLVLTDDPALSLRHLLVDIERVGLGDVRLRVCDLATALPFRLEDGRACEGLVCEGPVFLALGSYHIFALPTGAVAPMAWADTAADTWATFPERVYLDARVPLQGPGSGAPPRGRPVAVRARGAEDAPTLTSTMLPGPTCLRVRAGTVDDAAAVGWLTVTTGAELTRIPVDADDLERGVLIGRYRRCPISAQSATLSRVHLLIRGDRRAVFAIDTASTNGTGLGPHRRIRRAQLRDGDELSVGRVHVRWSPA